VGEVYVGTSGWSYRHWRGVWYPEGIPAKEYLAWYARRFPTTEVNATFYRLPRTSTVTRWTEATPAGFLFSVKAPRSITHLRKLRGVEEDWVRFREILKAFGEKLAAVLLQFPPSFRHDAETSSRLAEFLEKNRTYTFALEFRHASWIRPEVFDLLTNFRAAWVIADSSRYPSADVATADVVYYRFHGPKALYASCYTDAELESFAQRIAGHLSQRKKAFAYFNDDVQGCAVQNASRLRELLRRYDA